MVFDYKKEYKEFYMPKSKPSIVKIKIPNEIYLSDPRKCDVSKLKTVVRHPIKKID